MFLNHLESGFLIISHSRLLFCLLFKIFIVLVAYKPVIELLVYNLNHRREHRNYLIQLPSLSVEAQLILGAYRFVMTFVHIYSFKQEMLIECFLMSQA